MSSFWSGQLFNDYSRVKPTIKFKTNKIWKGSNNSAHPPASSEDGSENWQVQLKGYNTENENKIASHKHLDIQQSSQTYGHSPASSWLAEQKS